jgi:hypothetical protein
VVTSDSFEVVNGDPRFDTSYETINAKEAAERYVKRPYRDAWSYE